MENERHRIRRVQEKKRERESSKKMKKKKSRSSLHGNVNKKKYEKIKQTASETVK